MLVFKLIQLGLIGRNGKGKTTLLELLMSKYEYRGYITPNYIFDYFPYHIENENIRTLKIVENILGEFELWELQRELSLLDVENEVLKDNKLKYYWPFFFASLMILF